ncbi:MAG: DUF4215 domain-containing protein, partial [Polyangiaceae bacterium]|nr:DUF4215 domain-containing protein [Polyangiaceae bacterium]
EQCDDGNTTSGDGCSATCQDESVCGNGVQEPGEQCDDGNTADTDECSNACLANSPCARFCSGYPVVTIDVPFESASIGTAAVCYETSDPIAGGTCGNFLAGRTLQINDTLVTCNWQNWTPPASQYGGYCLEVSSGSVSYSGISLW